MAGEIAEKKREEFWMRKEKRHALNRETLLLAPREKVLNDRGPPQPAVELKNGRGP